MRRSSEKTRVADEATEAAAATLFYDPDDFRRDLVLATEQERRRWARNLHDETLQALAKLRNDLARSLERPGQGPRDAMASAIADLDEQIVELRRLIDHLRPTVLDQLGLEAALVALIDRVRRATTMHVDARLALDSKDRRLSEDIEIATYRLAQEALNNVLNHSRARTVRIAAARRDASLEMLIADDGVGFDVNTTVRGRGLAGMIEWVTLLEGRLQIRSRPGTGTTIEIEVPIVVAD